MNLVDSIKENLPKSWGFVELKDIAKIYDGTHQTPKYCETGIPFYSVEHVVADNFSKTKFISEEVFEKENKRVKLEKGDVLMTRIGNVGTAKYIDWDVKASFYVSLALFKCKDNINSRYLAQYINSYYFKKELWKKIIHVAFPIKINLGDLNKCKIPLPPLPEQQKIADILSTVDEKIAVIDQQIKATEELKKGLMQRLLTKGMGHTEFKDSPLGKIPKSWEVKPLRKASLLIKDGTHSTHKNVDKGIPLLSAKDVKGNRVLIPDDCRRISTVEFNKIHKNFRLKNGDILITLVGTIGRVALIKNYSENYTFQRSVGYVRLKDDCNALYFKYFFQSEYFTKELNRLSNASAQAGVYLGELGKIKCIIPCLKEQKEIAEILGKVDAKLQTQKDKKQAYQQLKKGLMQQLLTGKIRVTNLIKA
ncbi:MAG: hypothetical protein CMF35_15770 [Leeuwenhoekiella sp.]|uniref:restriction endonuclease subunit S n=1 Tax=Leeuwenhoekiella blandensis TaxID=360293 RepID=UPI000C588682|nr:restriction endonuclease subunit S [Leeuwenhoekiella blandensis]MBM09757.1 hypothetical protein [Magnetovibrio sp.]MBQ53120.1 hypothetical protein [Leeuwenhoekiella sp.]|tara:strand:- start:1317 stop:2579 length:1263 start_codon:yes stop_codon:yes gene_type:complete